MLVGRGSNDCLREGEQLLSRLKKDKQFPLTLLGFLNNTSVPGELQLLSSIQIRQWCEFFKVLLLACRTCRPSSATSTGT